jgi:hypothetical protein
MEDAMDSDSKTMFAALVQEETVVASTYVEEDLMTMSCLMALYGRDGATPQRGGSMLGRRKSKRRQRLEGYYILYADDPLHGEVVFRRCFGMSWMLFLSIVYVVRRFDTCYICKDCTGMVGLSSLQKCTTPLRMFAYGTLGNAHDDYICMIESTALECMYRFG